jgi:hypothetical protein
MRLLAGISVPTGSRDLERPPAAVFGPYTPDGPGGRLP